MMLGLFALKSTFYNEFKASAHQYKTCWQPCQKLHLTSFVTLAQKRGCARGYARPNSL